MTNINIKLPIALEERIKELVKSGFYSSEEEFIIEAVRLHLQQNQKFKEIERLSEKWVSSSSISSPYWPDNTFYHGFPPVGPHHHGQSSDNILLKSLGETFSRFSIS